MKIESIKRLCLFIGLELPQNDTKSINWVKSHSFSIIFGIRNGEFWKSVPWKGTFFKAKLKCTAKFGVLCMLFLKFTSKKFLKSFHATTIVKKILEKRPFKHQLSRANSSEWLDLVPELFLNMILRNILRKGTRKLIF